MCDIYLVDCSEMGPLNEKNVKTTQEKAYVAQGKTGYVSKRLCDWPVFSKCPWLWKRG